MQTQDQVDLITQFGQRLLKGLDSMTDFAVTQLPDVIQQLIMFKTVWYAFTVILMLIMISGYVAMVKHFYKLSEQKEELMGRECYFTDSQEVATAVLGFMMIPTVVFLIACIKNLMFIILAPKVWLIEYATDLLK